VRFTLAILIAPKISFKPAQPTDIHSIYYF
jgi:hypothetical protein